MIGEFEKELSFDSDTFEAAKRDMNFVLQRLVSTMMEKGTSEGCMNLKIDILLSKSVIPNFSLDIDGGMRTVFKPQFKHKVTSAVKINDEKSGVYDSEMEMVLDEDTGVFKLTPVANTTQRTIFDADFQSESSDRHTDDNSESGQNMIEGTCRPLLPGNVGVDDAGTEEELEDITDDLIGKDTNDDSDDSEDASEENE